MSKRCADIREAILRGGTTDDAAVRAHLAECPSCEAIVSMRLPLSTTLQTESMEPLQLRATFESTVSQIEMENRTISGWMKSRPTWMRMTLALGVVIAVIAAIVLLQPRVDLAHLMTIQLVVASIAIVLAIGAAVFAALRPVQVPTMSRRAGDGFCAMVVVGLGAFSMLLAPIHEGEGASPAALPCYFLGMLLCVPVFACVRALDRRATRSSAVLAACAAGTTAFVALHFHCAAPTREHVVESHFTVLLTILAVVAVVTSALLRRKR